MVTTIPETTAQDESNRQLTMYGLLGALGLFGLMGTLGFVMRLQHSGVLDLSSAQFYQVMTLHGLGMITAVVTGSVVGSWFLLNEVLETEELSRRLLTVPLVFIAVGALFVVVGVLLGFGAGWTMLHPLPILSQGTWGAPAFLLVFTGMMLVGVGGLIYFGAVVRATVAETGGFAQAMAWHVLFRGADSDSEPAVLIMTVSALAAILGLVSFALAIVGMTLQWTGAMTFDALVAKYLIYFGGHTIANVTIYVFAGMVYAYFPFYTGRKWPLDRIVALSWNLSFVFSFMMAFFHHLYMDFVQPFPLDVAGLLGSYGAAFPAIVITIYGGLVNVYRSDTEWRPGHLFMYGGLLAWAAGGFAAVVDSTIPVNLHFHNTLWVVGHFHTYLLLGVVSMMIGMAYYVAFDADGRADSSRLGTWAFWLFHVGGYGFVGTFLTLGVLGVPRRYASHPARAIPFDLLSLVFVSLIGIALLIVLREISTGLRTSATTEEPQEEEAPTPT
jgi:cytochrome c oxidase subunit 1